ncbi:hypothetical protein ACT691_11220 [Vibrio metschnikovii]
MMMAIAFESIVKLVAFLAVGLFVGYVIFSDHQHRRVGDCRANVSSPQLADIIGPYSVNHAGDYLPTTPISYHGGRK